MNLNRYCFSQNALADLKGPKEKKTALRMMCEETFRTATRHNTRYSNSKLKLYQDPLRAVSI